MKMVIIYIIKKGSIIKVDEIPGLTLKQKSKFNIGNIIVCHENTKFDSCQILLGKKSGFVCGPTPNPVRKLNAHMQWATNNIISIGHTFSCQGVMFKIYGANVFIGNNNMFSWGITIFTGDGHCIYDRDGNRINNNADVFLGNKIWCCSDSKILKGSFINDGSVIATCALVNKKFNEKNVIIAGSPAKIIKREIEWTRHPKKQ